MDKPLVTIAMPTYNQEKYVDEAVNGLLNQTYPNLEIVISDDASADSTFQRIQDAVNGYNGPHRIILNKNKRNLGIEHYSKLMKLSSGELMVIAHGDDISMPNRVEILVEAWQKSGTSMITSNVMNIDSEGNEIGQFSPKGFKPINDTEELARSGWNNSLHGATLAWTPDLFSVFGGLDPNKSSLTTDWVLPFRASLLNGIHYVDEILIKFRVHKDSKQGLYVNVNKKNPNHKFAFGKHLFVNILKSTGIWGKLQNNYHNNKFRFFTKSIGVDNIIADHERRAGNNLIQRLYMLDTLHHAVKIGLHSEEKLKPIEDQLVLSILENAGEWATLRNTLHNNRFRAIWEKLE